MYFIKYKRVLFPTNCKNHNWVVWSFRKCFVNVFVLFFFFRRFEPWAKWGLTNPKWQPWPLVNLPINSKRKEFYLSEKNRRAFSEGTKVSRSINAWIFSYFFPRWSHLVFFCRPIKMKLLLIKVRIMQLLYQNLLLTWHNLQIWAAWTGILTVDIPSQCTAFWKLSNFLATEILCDINFGWFHFVQNCRFNNFWGFEFLFLEKFYTWKRQTFTKIQN